MKALCRLLYFFALLLSSSIIAEDTPVTVITSAEAPIDPRYGNHLHESICQAILNAKKSIRLFNYSSQDGLFQEALNKKAQEGLDIGAIFDKAHLPAPGSYHPNIKIFTRKTGEGHYHHKIFLIDDDLIFIGTANITGMNSWPNIMVAVRSKKLAEPIHEEWSFYARGTPRSHYHSEDTVAGQKIELFMMPHVASPASQQKENEANQAAFNLFINEINKAERKIVASCVVWTLKDFARAMVKASIERKVDVVCYTANMDPNVTSILALAGIRVYHVNATHHKTLLIDNEVFINGSANWSMSAFSRSDESVTYIPHATSIQAEKVQHAIYKLN